MKKEELSKCCGAKKIHTEAGYDENDSYLCEKCHRIFVPQQQEEVNEAINEMVSRFLGWELPKDFKPDGGISFDGVSNPIGTHLLTATQAEKMIRFVVSDSLDNLKSLWQKEAREETLNKLVQGINGLPPYTGELPGLKLFNILDIEDLINSLK